MKSRKLVTLFLAGLLVMAGSLAASSAFALGRAFLPAKNVIFMVPDGMGISYVTATRIFVNGPDGDPLHFETLPQIGYQRTHSANSTVTDSAAAASAWAAGDKFLNGEISCHSVDDVCVENPATILELAKAKGKATGLVASSTITHATPAAFGAHSHSRQCQAEIGRQFVEETMVDVLLGGGIGGNKADYNCEQYPGQDPAAPVAAALAAGYSYVTNETEMNAAVAAGAERVLGLFTPGGKTPELFWVDGSTYPAGEPTLAEMTEAALDVLEEDRDGFFLMVEGSQIDWAGHANDINYLIGDTIAFDESVKKVLDWLDERPMRKMRTLLVVVGDHETGGMMIDGPYGSLSAPGDIIQAGWTSTNHSAQDTIIWSQGPGSRQLGAALQNTDLFDAMNNVLR
jgi:alkaline phosphatase